MTVVTSSKYPAPHVPEDKVAFEKGLEEIVLIIYKYSTDDKYRRDFSLLADHFGIQEKKVSKGKYKSTCVRACI